MTKRQWPEPRSAYVHVPFCRHRCGYCNFSVIANRDDLIDRYVNAIDLELGELGNPVIETLFVGGGTPTHLKAKTLARFLDNTIAKFRCDKTVEITVEANPEDINDEVLAVLSGHGINRISLGVQSFQSDKLSILQRSHDRDVAIRAIEKSADRIGNVSIDLIFAAPGESIQGWKSDLQIALALPIDHLSTYALTFEKGTQFWSLRKQGSLNGLEEETEIQMYQIARQMTAAAGLDQYEISNFARPWKKCLHNLAYWQGRAWYAAGPGAARFVDGQRQVNHRSTTTYLKKIESGQSPVSESETISEVQNARERFAFGVRLIEGIDVKLLSNETGVDLQTLCKEELDRLESENLIRRPGDRIQLTEQGILFADTVASELLG